MVNGTVPIYVVRHGATKMNNQTDLSEDRIRGWSDVPLSDEGREDAKKAAEKLKPIGIQIIIASRLHRAVETAHIISQQLGGIPVQISPNLVPWNLGNLTGTTTKDALPVIEQFVREHPDQPIPGGESFNQFVARANQGLAEAIKLAAGRPAAVVTHHRDERLWKAEEAAGWAPGQVDLNTFLQKGDPPGGVYELNVNPAALAPQGAGGQPLGVPLSLPGQSPGGPPPMPAPQGGQPMASPPGLPGPAGGQPPMPMGGPPPGLPGPQGAPAPGLPVPAGAGQPPAPGQPSGIPGQPPPGGAPPQVNPAFAKMMEFQQKLGQIAKAIQLLREDGPRGYRVDIEIDTMVAGDQAVERQDASEFLEAVTKFVTAAGQIVMVQPDFAPLAGKMLQFGVRKFRTGRELESSIDEYVDKLTKQTQASAGKPKPPSPEQIKAQVEQTKAQAEIERSKMDAQSQQANDQREQQSQAMDFAHKTQLNKMQMQMEQQKMQHETQQMQLQMQIQTMKMQIEQHKAGLEQQAAAADHQRQQEAKTLEFHINKQSLDHQGQFNADEHRRKTEVAEHKHKQGMMQPQSNGSATQ